MVAPDGRVSRAKLVLTSLLIVVGSCGTINGIGTATYDSVPAAANVQENADIDEATEGLNRALEATRAQSPFRRFLGISNAIVSVLLVLGGVFLLLNRTAAVWWITQAAIANILYCFIEAAADVHQVFASSAELGPVFEVWGRAQAAEAGGPATWSLTGDQYVMVTAVVMVCTGLLKASFIGWLGWRARRTDIQTLLENAERT